MEKLQEMAVTVLSGQLFNDPDSVKDWRDQFGKFDKVVTALKQSFDKQLKQYLTTNGTDSLPGVDFFRQPKGWEKVEALNEAVELMAQLQEAFAD